MKRLMLFVVLLGAVALALPLVASAGGWAGSIYDKSECSYSRDTNSLFCQTTVTVESARTEVMSFTDTSCPNGTRGVRRTGTHVEVTQFFDGFTGHTPVDNHHVFGNSFPVFIGWREFTDTDLGCN